MTLTAPSFGAVHHVPQVVGSWRRCSCGSYHQPEDEHLRGVPVDVERYDYSAAVAWNRDVGLLWANTRRVLVELLPGMEYAKVYEMQARLALHAHAILRVPASVRIDPDELAAAIGRVTASSVVDGLVWSWGSHGVDVKPLTEAHLTERGGVFARTTGYMAKMISYVSKSIHSATVGHRVHMARMHEAAHAMRCDRCPEVNLFGVRPRCTAALHRRMGARQVVVTTSRPGKVKPGWSLSGQTRRALRVLRQQFMAAKSAGGSEAEAGSHEHRMLEAKAGKRLLAREIHLSESRLRLSG